MKKLTAIAAILAIAISLAACGDKNSDSTEATSVTNETQSSHQDQKTDQATESSSTATNVATEPTEEEGYLFHVDDLEIAMNADAEPILSALGEPKNYTEETSCAFEGLDKTYFYGSFYLQTYPEKDKDFVYCLWFADDSVATDEGIRIGSSQADVEKAYGADGYNGSNAYIFARGNTEMTIILKDGGVNSVQYMVLGV